MPECLGEEILFKYDTNKKNPPVLPGGFALDNNIIAGSYLAALVRCSLFSALRRYVCLDWRP